MRGKNAARAAPMLALAATQLLLGRADVGPAREQLRRQAGRQLDRNLLLVERQAGRQVGGQRLADEQHERVLVERAHAHRLRQRDARAFDQRLGLAVVELRRRRRCRSAAW